MQVRLNNFSLSNDHVFPCKWVALRRSTGVPATSNYLTDPRTNMLYTRPTSALEWPMPVGKVAAGGRMMMFASDSNNAMEFFKVWRRGTCARLQETVVAVPTGLPSAWV